MPGVRAVAPEVWGIAPTIEGRGMLIKGLLAGKGINSILDQPVIAGQDIVAHQNLHSAVFPRALKENGAGPVPRARRPRPAECRDQPEDRQPASRRPGPPQEGRRHLADRRQAVPDRRHL